MTKAGAATTAGTAVELMTTAGAPYQTPPPEAMPAHLHLVPRLDSLLRQAERIAAAPRNPKTDLRPVSMQDFEEALKEVGASVNPDSSVIQELNEWNAQFGTTGSKGGVRSKRLSYYT